MRFFNFFKRSKNQDIKPPCPTPTPNGQGGSLSNIATLLGGANLMNLSPFFAGVNLIANSIAVTKLLFKDADDELLKPTHYLWHMFDDSELTKFNTLKSVVVDMILYGNGFIYIERDDETGKPITLHYSAAKDTTIFYNKLQNKVYYRNPFFSKKWDNGDNYLHFYLNSNDGFNGLSIPSYAYKTVELSAYTEKAAYDYYSSGLRYFGLITLENQGDFAVGTRDKQLIDMKNSWHEAQIQSRGTGTIFMPADLKFQQLSSTAKDASLIEARLYNVQEAARWLGMSPINLGDYSHTFYNSLSEAQKGLIIYTLTPYFVCIEEEMNRKLIMPSKRGIEHVDLDENSIMIVDVEQQVKIWTEAAREGVITRNEARKKLGLPPVDGGDSLVVAYTNISDNTIGAKEEEAEKDAGQEDE